jgi:hypothetical protein
MLGFFYIGRMLTSDVDSLPINLRAKNQRARPGRERRLHQCALGLRRYEGLSRHSADARGAVARFPLGCRGAQQGRLGRRERVSNGVRAFGHVQLRKTGARLCACELRLDEGEIRAIIETTYMRA